MNSQCLLDSNMLCLCRKINSQVSFLNSNTLVVFVLEANETLIFCFEPWPCLLCLCWKQAKLSFFISNLEHACVCIGSKWNSPFLFRTLSMPVMFVLEANETLILYFEPWALLCLCWKHAKLSIFVSNLEHACYVCVGSKRNSHFLFRTLSMLVVFVLEANDFRDPPESQSGSTQFLCRNQNAFLLPAFTTALQANNPLIHTPVTPSRCVSAVLWNMVGNQGENIGSKWNSQCLFRILNLLVGKRNSQCRNVSLLAVFVLEESMLAHFLRMGTTTQANNDMIETT